MADTGAWLPGRQVLITPHVIDHLDQAKRILRVKLTRKQIEKSPSIESHKPVSRQYEEEYYRYYGWPQYWMGDGLWGMTGVPIVALPPKALPDKSAAATDLDPEPAETHLRSTQAVNGYHFQTAEGIIGHVCDFMMDASSWAIGQLVVKTGHRLSGEEMLVPTKCIERISYEESTVYADLGREVAGPHPTPNLVPAGAES
jgi:hypothetical protein